MLNVPKVESVHQVTVPQAVCRQPIAGVNYGARERLIGIDPKPIASSHNTDRERLRTNVLATEEVFTNNMASCTLKCSDKSYSVWA